MTKKKVIYTVGHSTHTTREFIKMLRSFGVELLIDVRHYPGSRFCPQFNAPRLKRNLKRHNIEYQHHLDLGGRRKVDPDSDLNNGWNNSQFRAYADYMQSKEFKVALKELINCAKNKTLAIMCAEAVPWRCHRSMIADALLVHGLVVLDIMGINNERAHKLTSFAKVAGKKLTYPKPSDMK